MEKKIIAYLLFFFSIPLETCNSSEFSGSGKNAAKPVQKKQEIVRDESPAIPPSNRSLRVVDWGSLLAKPVYLNTPSKHCGGAEPFESDAPQAVQSCDVKYLDDCWGNNPGANNNIKEEMDKGLCVATNCDVIDRWDWGYYTCHGKSELLRNKKVFSEQSQTSPKSNPGINSTEISTGANIWDDKEKTAVTECVKNGHYFDRSIDIVGGTVSACQSSVNTANFDCSIDGIIRGTRLLNQEIGNLNSILTDKLAGFLLDQCIDYDNGYFRIYFVKPLDNEFTVSLKYLEIPK